MIEPKKNLYILKGTDVVSCDDTKAWEAAFRSEDRIIFRTRVGKYEISTVFLGMNVGYGNQKLFFETMIFYKKNGKDLQSTLAYQTRCETWTDCAGMHLIAQNFVKNMLKERKVTWHDRQRPTYD